MRSNFIQIMLNFAPMLLSLFFLQIIVLPDLYKINTGEYVQFNYLLYTALMFVHVVNSANFNSSVINSKVTNKSEFDVSKFLYCGVLYSIIVFYFWIFNFFSLSILIFILLLYPIDLLINFLRLVEKDKHIAIVLIQQSFIFVSSYCTSFLNVFNSYSLANSVCLLFFIPLLSKNLNSFYIEKLSKQTADLSVLISVSIPTINRYLDKVFILLFFSQKFVASSFPFIAVAGLILMPMSAVSKVLVRSKGFAVSKEKIYFYISMLYPVIFIILFGLVNLGVRLFYPSNTDFDMWVVIVICLAKALNLVELLVFSLFSSDINYESKYTAISRFITLAMFVFICIGTFFNINISDYGVFILLVYFSFSTYLLLYSVRGRN